MARQIEKLSDKFGTGGGKDGSPEEKFFTDTDFNIDPEWKALDLLRAQVETISDTVNANDEASGSYATLKRAYLGASGSFSTRATANDAKIGTTSTERTRIAANHAKVSYATAASNAVAANTLKTGVSITSPFTIDFGIRANDDTGAPETLTITIVNRTEGVEEENATKTVQLSLR